VSSVQFSSVEFNHSVCALSLIKFRFQHSEIHGETPAYALSADGKES